MADIKSMTLEQARAYRKTLYDQGKTESTSKEVGKVSDYIKVLKSQAGEGGYGQKELASAYTNLSRGVTETGGWTEKNLDNIEKYTGSRPQLTSPAGSGVAGGDLSAALSGYQDSVFGASNNVELRESIINQLEPEGEKPELLNRVEEYEKLRGEMGVADLETTLNDLKAQLEEQYATKRARTFDAEGKPVAMGVIAGRVGEIERQENERIDAIGRQINVINDQLQTSYSVIEQYMSLMSLDYQDAVAQYNADYSRNLQIYQLVDEEMDEQVASARANLQTYMNAITSGNLNYSNLSANQKLAINKMEIQSNLPVGFVSSLKMNPKDQIFATSSDGSQVTIIDENGHFQTLNTGITPKADKVTESEKIADAQKRIMSDLNDVTDWKDGYVSPKDYRDLANQWANAGFDLETFYSFSRGKVNPTHYQDYGIPDKYISA